MGTKKLLYLFIFFALLAPKPLLAMAPDQFLVLCYHSVQAQAIQGDTYGISHQQFVEQMEYLRTHDYHPVSLATVLAAADGKMTLPPKAVLLTFDDAYRSFKEFIVPVLKWYGYPSLLSVVGRWIDAPPTGLPEPLLSWKELNELKADKQVEIVSHSYDLHKGIQYNPAGNTASIVSVRAYDPQNKRYETENEYRNRIKEDFLKQSRLFKEKLNHKTDVITWPYGRFNQISVEVAQEMGYSYGFTLEEGLNDLSRMDRMNRVLVESGKMDDFISLLNNPEGQKPHIRSVQVDLDLIYDPHSYEQTDKNLGLLIERLVAMKVNTVFLQAFSDADGDGNVEEVYFYNRILPVKADIFSHAAHQMAIRDMQVHAWMPVLAYVLPDKALNEELGIREVDEQNQLRLTRSWYRRLSPFSKQVKEIVSMLFEDLSAHAQVHGVLFQDDAYLTDREDFHPDAATFNRNYLDGEITIDKVVSETPQNRLWANHNSVIGFSKIPAYILRPNLATGRYLRTLFINFRVKSIRTALFPLAQNFPLFLDNYDHVVVMAYPQLENADRPNRWLRRLVKKAAGHADGLDKTIFKIQAFDWDRRQWIKTDLLLDQLKEILASGDRHLAYYPDNLWENRPVLDTIKLEMSTHSFPFIR